jgi:hypothetical protein
MSLTEILKSNPELAGKLTISNTIADLMEFAKYCIELERQEKPEPKPEEYLTPQQAIEMLRISNVTLWHYDKKKITNPVRVGGKRLYRASDLEKLLSVR